MGGVILRKHIRSILRHSAEKHHIKPSKHIAAAWEDFQINKVGYTRRRINQAKGTAPKHKWRSRIEAVVG